LEENYIMILAIVVVSYLIIESVLGIWVNFVRKKFQWLITNADKEPELSQEGLMKFFSHGYDRDLGWIRKPNSKHKEIGKEGTVEWTTNKIGARTNPGFDNKENSISCYGDSFTFCRQVNDNETWEHELSKLTNSNVLNFGVGNYGIDQSLLRLKKEYASNKTKIVIMAVVPDTISRIMSYWKHYYEYGNTFGFKPKFEEIDGRIEEIPNIINDETKFGEYKQYLDKIKEHDFFYKNKFKKEIIQFPYTISIFKNFKRNFSILYWVTLIELRKKLSKNYKIIEWKPMSVIMKINLNWRIKLYENSIAVSLLIGILKEYVKYAEAENFVPVFTFLPQKDDLIEMGENRFELDVWNKIKSINGLNTLDIIDELTHIDNYDDMFSDSNEYGGHYSKKGNKEIAKIIYKNLVKKKLC
jgi:hypothetical protein